MKRVTVGEVKGTLRSTVACRFSMSLDWARDSRRDHVTLE